MASHICSVACSHGAGTQLTLAGGPHWGQQSYYVHTASCWAGSNLMEKKLSASSEYLSMNSL